MLDPASPSTQPPTHGWTTGSPVLGYPDPAIEILDPRFARYRLGNAAIERLWTGGRWTEGPVWFGDGRYLLWSDIPNNRILRWSEETGTVSVFRSPAQYSSGNTRDRQGRLITWEHETRRLTRTEYDGHITVLIGQFEGDNPWTASHCIPFRRTHASSSSSRITIYFHMLT